MDQTAPAAKADTDAAIDLATHPLTRWTGPLGLPDFAALRDEAFEPVFEAALAAHRAELEAIAIDARPPDVETVLIPLELAGDALGRVSAIFWCKAGADTNPAIQAVERRIAPKMARHFSALYMDTALFGRIDALHAGRDALGLDPETRRVVEKTWKRFVRAGARLDAADKERLAAINERLAELGARFGQNVLADESGWALFLDEDSLEGLPDFVRSAMAEAARARGREGAYAVTLSRSLAEPFLAYADRRDLREKVYRAFLARGEGAGEADNRPIIAETLALRAEKARLLGYENYAAYKLEDMMAKTPEAVMGLLEPVWEKARRRAAEVEAALSRIAAAEGRNDAIAGWDWRYYQEKLRAERFAFDDGAVKPYLQLERVMAAAFDVAGRLFGLRFREHADVAAWHPDVRVFEVLDADGTPRGTFLADYFNRPSKRSGAWMGALESAHRLGEGARPVIYNVTNFAAPAKGEPALLSLDEARTLFHEFGHALHGLLSGVRWPSISGTSVSRDFVELPSQLFEHWLTVPAILKKHCVHYRTGEPIPEAMVEKMRAARTFGTAFNTIEFTASALVDMASHAAATPPSDPARFEAETLARLEMPSAIAMRHRSPHFAHVFAGDGYSAGYYSYMWSEVLDADAFAAFEERGDPFDPELAARLKTHIYAAGGSAEPETLYTAFRGRMPTPDAMMAKRGLD